MTVNNPPVVFIVVLTLLVEALLGVLFFFGYTLGRESNTRKKV